VYGGGLAGEIGERGQLSDIRNGSIGASTRLLRRNGRCSESGVPAVYREDLSEFIGNVWREGSRSMKRGLEVKLLIMKFAEISIATSL